MVRPGAVLVLSETWLNMCSENLLFHNECYSKSQYLNWLNNIKYTILICSEPPGEIAEKPNLTWLDAAQVPVIESSL